MRNTTVAPTQKSTVRETITLETPKATVTDIKTARKDREWLMQDSCSAPYATIEREVQPAYSREDETTRTMLADMPTA